MIRPRHRVLLVSILLVVGGLVVAVPPPPADAAVTPCSNGLVALTFDDGPRPITNDFIDVLLNGGVPATFFKVGYRVAETPGITRNAWRSGFKIGNHSYQHENLTRLSNAGIRSTLQRTSQAIRNAGAVPSNLMRPPYGAVNDRVRTVARGMGLRTVLWTIDPRDWDGRSSWAISSSVLGHLRPHATNIVLLHDGVANSPRTLAALPRIISVARGRGYCFAGLSSRGLPTPPVPRARISDASAQEPPGSAAVEARITLDRPTSRVTSVRVRTVGETATSGVDYAPVDTRVYFPVGVTTRAIRVPLRGDLLDEDTERFTIRLSDARGLSIADPAGDATISDNDPPPDLSVLDTTVLEPSTGQVTVPVTLRLNRPSGRSIRVTVRTVPGTADTADFVAEQQSVTFAPGVVTVQVPVTVLADTVVEGPETFTVQVVDSTNVTVPAPVGLVTIQPPP